MERQIKNILVTGGAGFIGSAFIRYLLSNDRSFEGLCINLDVLTYAGNIENLSSIESDPRYRFVRADIRQQALVEELIDKYKVDTLIHFAAESHVDRSILGPQAFVETNIVGTFHLLEAVRKHPHVHFHHVSTDEVYGSLGPTGAFTEETSYQPNSPYSASKAASDHLVKAYGHTYNLSICLSNCSNNYGPYQFPEKLIPVMILNAMQRKPLPIYGEGINIRDWLHVDDHAAALYLLLKKGRQGETYNVGGGAEWRNIDLVHQIIETISDSEGVPVAELKQLITFIKDRPGHDLRYAIDFTKIQRELGWLPKRTFAEGLKETVDWYRQNRVWINNVQTGIYREWIETNYAGR